MLAILYLPERLINCSIIIFVDMGCGEVDGSYREQLYNPSMNTTNHLKKELYRTDFVMHIGDMSYAQGYGAIVSSTI